MNEREESIGWARKPHSERCEGVLCVLVLLCPRGGLSWSPAGYLAPCPADTQRLGEPHPLIVAKDGRASSLSLLCLSGDAN